MGEALLANGNALESLSYFNNLPEDDGGALIGKALACARLGKEKEAETYFQKAMHNCLLTTRHAQTKLRQ